MREAAIYFKGILAGRLTEDESGYTFCYDKEYLHQPEAVAISLTMPLSDKSYSSHTMIPFFDGLIPEGWLLDVASHNWKINPRDRMGLLMACCTDCIGAVSIVPIHTN